MSIIQKAMLDTSEVARRSEQECEEVVASAKVEMGRLLLLGRKRVREAATLTEMDQRHAEATRALDQATARGNEEVSRILDQRVKDTKDIWFARVNLVVVAVFVCVLVGVWICL